MKLKLILFLGTIFLSFQCLLSQHNSNGESPYFFISSKNVGHDDFPLLSTTADVQITGPVANVIIKQVYSNKGTVPIEAVYVFPGSTRAAVHDMKMKIGDRIIQAKIHEKQKARQKYEKAKSEGRRASLLEQHRPNVFQMNVANILPGDLIEVELSYTEFLIPESGQYQFVYPTVVGPRFSDKTAQPGSASFVSMPYTKEGVRASYSFDISVVLNAGIPIKSCQSTSHKVDVKYENGHGARITLNRQKKEEHANKDFILTFSLADNQIESGTMLFEDGIEKYFLTTIEAPRHFESSSIPQREYIFVIDVSGSMNGYPIDISKRLMKELLGKMNDCDVFNVLLFASDNSVLATESIPVTNENLDRAFKIIDQQQGGGGTRLLPALKKAFSMAKDPNRSSSIIVITDGYVHVEEEAFQIIQNNLNKANVFSFGIGSSVNRFIIEGMAHVGRGEPFIITGQERAHEMANKFKKYIEHPLLTNVSVEFDGLDIYDVFPSFSPDLMAERPIYVFGKYKGEARGKVTLKGMTGTGKYMQEFDVSRVRAVESNRALKYLWAREKIRELSDFAALSHDDKRKEKITQLGLKYNLLTKYTSFLAEEKTQVLKNGEMTYQVKQPLPLPQGVSNYAVGFEMEHEYTSVVKSRKKLSANWVFHKDLDAKRNVLIKTTIERILEKEKLDNSQIRFAIYINGGTLIVSDPHDHLSDHVQKQIINLIRSIFPELSYSNGIFVKLN